MIVLAKKSESHRLVIGKNIVQANKSKESVTQDSDTKFLFYTSKAEFSRTDIHLLSQTHAFQETKVLKIKYL